MTALQYTSKTDKELNMKPVADNFRHTLFETQNVYKKKTKQNMNVKKFS